MKIQEYSELVAMVAKIESMKANAEAIKKELKEMPDGDPDAWLALYDKEKKAKSRLNRAYKEFRAKIETEEYRYLAHEFNCSLDKSDRRFYWSVRYAIVREGRQVEFTTGE